MAKRPHETYEYEYREAGTGAHGFDYVEADSAAEAAKLLLEKSRGGDVEVINPRKVK